ncbi:MAG TPA: hypothetical protein HPP83_10010 [Candidatus Hydrogenedentes bacterium]|nr:hypothetical protein [Candidatus Hydrogenedentota bacterium]
MIMLATLSAMALWFAAIPFALGVYSVRNRRKRLLALALAVGWCLLWFMVLLRLIP